MSRLRGFAAPVRVSRLVVTGVSTFSLIALAACVTSSGGSGQEHNPSDAGAAEDRAQDVFLDRTHPPDVASPDAASSDVVSSDVAAPDGDASVAGDAPGGEGGSDATSSGDASVLQGSLAANGAACAVQATGQVECWGYGPDGDMGAGLVSGATCLLGGGAASTQACFPTPVVVANLSGVIALAAGFDTNCALLANGTVACWGQNAYGALGDGTTTGPDQCPVWPSPPDAGVQDPCSTKPVTVAGVSTAVGISVGAEGACAVLADGTVYCWGGDTYGELGFVPDASTGWPTPVRVASVSNAVAVTSGFYHHCALLADGTVTCWGYDVDGELGSGTSEKCAGAICSPTAVAVPSLSGVKAIAAGAFHTCAILSGGTVECWGLNGDGQLGDGSTQSSTTPVPVSGLSGAVAIAAGEVETCALLESGSVVCWGNNTDGELGTGAAGGPDSCGGDFCSKVPVQVKSISGATAIAVGENFVCARVASGAVECWGENNLGQLGIGCTDGPGLCTPPGQTYTTACSAIPVPVNGNVACASDAGSDGTTTADAEIDGGSDAGDAGLPPDAGGRCSGSAPPCVQGYIPSTDGGMNTYVGTWCLPAIPGQGPTGCGL